MKNSVLDTFDPAVVARILSEYREMPGLLLTAGQTARLCGLDRAHCQAALDHLVSMRVLTYHTGRYAKA